MCNTGGTRLTRGKVVGVYPVQCYFSQQKCHMDLDGIP